LIAPINRIKELPDMTGSLLRNLAAAAFGCLITLGAQAQNYSSPNNGPFRTTSDGADTLLMLEGHDAVAYFTQNAAVKGDPAIKLEHQGVTYRFASEANKAEFQKAPEKYMPQFGGFCSNGINYAVPWGSGGGPNTWRIYRGKLYVFGGQKSRDHFEMETEVNLERAHRYWNDEVAGSNALFTRYKRLIFRVPHYKTDKALQDEWEAKLAAKTLPVMPGAAQVVPAQ
jgi:YHS domain-containing protein